MIIKRICGNVLIENEENILQKIRNCKVDTAFHTHTHKEKKKNIYMNLKEFRKPIINKINHLICNNPEMKTGRGTRAENYVSGKDYNRTEFLLGKNEISLSFNLKIYSNWREKRNNIRQIKTCENIYSITKPQH